MCGISAVMNTETPRNSHRHISRGEGGYSPPKSTEPSFFGLKPAAKNEKKSILWYLLNEKYRIHSVHQDEVPKMWVFILMNNDGCWAKQFRMNLYWLHCERYQLFDSTLFGMVRVEFFRALPKNFLDKDGSAPPLLQKMGCTPMDTVRFQLQSHFSCRGTSWNCLAYTFTVFVSVEVILKTCLTLHFVSGNLVITVKC